MLRHYNGNEFLISPHLQRRTQGSDYDANVAFCPRKPAKAEPQRFKVWQCSCDRSPRGRQHRSIAALVFPLSKDHSEHHLCRFLFHGAAQRSSTRGSRNFSDALTFLFPQHLCLNLWTGLIRRTQAQRIDWRNWDKTRLMIARNQQKVSVFAVFLPPRHRALKASEHQSVPHRDAAISSLIHSEAQMKTKTDKSLKFVCPGSI